MTMTTRVRKSGGLGKGVQRPRGGARKSKGDRVCRVHRQRQQWKRKQSLPRLLWPRRWRMPSTEQQTLRRCKERWRSRQNETVPWKVRGRKSEMENAWRPDGARRPRRRTTPICCSHHFRLGRGQAIPWSTFTLPTAELRSWHSHHLRMQQPRRLPERPPQAARFRLVQAILVPAPSWRHSSDRPLREDREAIVAQHL